MLAFPANIRPLSSKNLLRRLYLDPTCFRSVSTVHLDPAIRGFAAALLKKQPCFSMHPKDVHVLSEPQQFHQRLLVSHCRICLAADIFCSQTALQDMVHRARRRIFISSLYIGHADKRLV
jgi:CDP-diacylglycerol--glycerol-3-phosphate 3-phosphatidyltransferase